MSQNDITLEFQDSAILSALYGPHNAHLRHLEDRLGVSINTKSNMLHITGAAAAVASCEKILRDMETDIHNNNPVSTATIDAAVRFLDEKPKKKTAPKGGKKIVIETKKKSIQARSPNQNTYLNAMDKQSMVFGLGPAGTGKTYLAVAMGVSMFLRGEVERLIFTRPAVEAGESLGFLPGDLKDKVDPYLRPIYDAMQDMMPMEFMSKKMENGEIEVAPLAFMRGRTLSNAFVILDEAQNTTCTQMKMFLTRMGEASRMVVTGDLSQTDLPRGMKSGLRDAVEVLEGVDDIAFMHFNKDDVIRHPLVSKIVNAYDRNTR